MPEGMDQQAGPLSEDAMAIVELAAHMPTKLWINEITEPPPGDPLGEAKRRVIALNHRRAGEGLTALNDLDVLVICGQLTTCYTLMTHLWAHHRKPSGSWDHPGAERVFREACALWNRAREQPAVLLDERKKAASITD